MLIMFIKRFEFLGYWRLRELQSILYLLNNGVFCAALHDKTTRNLAISWRVYHSQGLVYIPVHIQAFRLHIFSRDVSIGVNVLIFFTEKCQMVRNVAMSITGWRTELCSLVWFS